MKKVILTTTLNLLCQHGACAQGYRTLLKHVGAGYDKDAPINLLTILESNGVQDMMWCLRATQQDCVKQRYLICADMAKSVLHIFEKKYPKDKRPAEAIKAARAAADGKITDEKRWEAYAYAAAAAAAAAAYDAAAYNAATAAVYAANDAYTAYAAEYAAAAVYDYANAAYAVYATYTAAYADAYAAHAAAAAAREAERKKQASIIKRYLSRVER